MPKICGEIRRSAPESPADGVATRIAIVPELNIARNVDLEALRWVGTGRASTYLNNLQDGIMQLFFEIF
jgi:hypothetical protein